MKTCSFRGARPDRSIQQHHGLFCYHEPKACYGMIQCRRRTCHFCFPLKEITKIRRLQQSQNFEPVVQFLSIQKHRFVSGYEAILNCPTVSINLFSIFFMFYNLLMNSLVKQRILFMHWHVLVVNLIILVILLWL